MYLRFEIEQGDFVPKGVNPMQSPSSTPKSNEGFKPHPLTQFLSRLSPEEQFRVVSTHPLFTSCCPDCGYKFPIADAPRMLWDCIDCGWLDDAA